MNIQPSTSNINIHGLGSADQCEFGRWTLDVMLDIPLPLAMTKTARISYGIMALLLVLIGWLHMATLFLDGPLRLLRAELS
jgi:hypothetical protein